MRVVWLTHTPEGALDEKHTCFIHGVPLAHIRADCWQFERRRGDESPWLYEVSVQKALFSGYEKAHFSVYTGRAPTLDAAKAEAVKQMQLFDALLRLGWEP